MIARKTPKTMQAIGELITSEEAAEMTGLAINTIRKYCAEKIFDAFMPNGASKLGWKIRKQSVINFMSGVKK